jgi:hypothetical protein
MDGGFYEEEEMTIRRKKKLVHEGQYVAEVEVEVIDTELAWSPYLSLEDAYKLDDVRSALRRGDLKTASTLARVYSLTPVVA